MLLIAVLISCSVGPSKIKIGEDACSFCKMSISDDRFGAEILTKKGKVYKFDDLHCVLAFIKAGTVNKDEFKETYIVDFNKPHALIELANIKLLKSIELRSPMGANIAGFTDQKSLKEAMATFNGSQMMWVDLLNEKL